MYELLRIGVLGVVSDAVEMEVLLSERGKSIDDMPLSLYPESRREPISGDLTAPPSTSRTSSAVKTVSRTAGESGMPQQVGTAWESDRSASLMCVRVALGDKTWPHVSNLESRDLELRVWWDGEGQVLGSFRKSENRVERFLGRGALSRDEERAGTEWTATGGR